MKRTTLKLIFILGILSLSCKVRLLPDYHAAMEQKIEDLAKHVDAFYTNMLFDTEEQNNGRAYQKFSKFYHQIEYELKWLLYRNQARPLNQNSVKICQNALELWQKYKKQHQDKNSISNANIELNMKYLESIFTSLILSEHLKKQ